MCAHRFCCTRSFIAAVCSEGHLYGNPYANATGTTAGKPGLNSQELEIFRSRSTEIEYRTSILKYDIRPGPVSCLSYQISCTVIAFHVRTPVGPDSARCSPPAAFCPQLPLSVSAGMCGGALVLQRGGGTFAANAPARHAPASPTTHEYLVLRARCWFLSLHRFGLHTLFCAVLCPLLTYLVFFELEVYQSAHVVC